MGFLQNLRALFAGKPSGDRYMPIYLYSRRCGEAIAGRVDLMNELSAADADNASTSEGGAAGEAQGAPSGGVWFVRKVLDTSGRNRCFDSVEVRLWLDAQKRVLKHEVDRGRWLEHGEYTQIEQARLAAEQAAAEQAAEQAAAEKPGASPSGEQEQ